MRQAGLFVAFLATLLFTIAPSRCWAAESAAPIRPENEEQAQAIAENVMSPFCPGRTLAACPSEDARKLREQIVHWIADGYSEPAVYGLLETTYGQEVRGIPRRTGFGLLGWITPPIFLLLLSFGVWRMLKRMQARTAGAGNGAPVSEVNAGADRARIADELAERMRR